MAHTLAHQLCMEKMPEHKVRVWRSSLFKDTVIGQSPNELVRQNECFIFCAFLKRKTLQMRQIFFLGAMVLMSRLDCVPGKC